MNEDVEYVVPPSSGSPKGPSKPVMTPPKKPNKFGSWIRTNKLQAASGLVMICIVVLVAILMGTGKKISIFGININPLYDQASCPIDNGNSCVPIDTEPPTDTTPTASTLSITGNFPNAVLNTPYTANFQTVNGNTNCTFTLGTITPTLPRATVSVVTQPASDNPETIGVFNVVPDATGNFDITVTAACPPLVGTGPTLSATKNFTLVVGQATTGVLDIVGNFGAGSVGLPYSATISTVNAQGKTCDFTQTTLPSIPGAALVRVNSTIITPETSVEYRATPATSGNFVVTVIVTCTPTNGDPATLSAQKDFNFVVSGVHQPPVVNDLDISGTFADGRVGQAYQTALVTDVRANYKPCTWTLNSIVPSMAGATLTVDSSFPQSLQSRATFAANPSSAGTYTVNVSIGCQLGHAGTHSFTWIVTSGTTGGGGNGGGTGGGSGGGATASSCSTERTKLTAIYRFWKGNVGDHFFTTNPNEKPAGYTAEGIAGYVYNAQVAGTSPIYRSYSPTSIAHYYSTTNDATNYGYNNEGIIGYAYTGNATGAMPWFRLHKGYPQSDYLETISVQEKGQAMAIGYLDEGSVANICERNI